MRTDRWWVQPLFTAVVLAVFLAYTVVRIFMRKWYWSNEYSYLTPLYSPCLSTSCAPGSSHFGTPLGDFPIVIPVTIISFIIILGFRGTCYYYRKAVYRSFLMAPAACAVPEPHKKYTGEARFPLIVQNSHRYFFYFASILLLINTFDAIKAFFPSYGGFGIGLGSLILLANATTLWLYTLSCHACRHVMGGKLKHFSRHPLRYRMWGFVSKLNGKHMQYAWTSLLVVMVTDIYIMSVSAGWISDLRIVN